MSPTPEGAVATLGGGCFWCTEAICRQLKGVVEVVAGYSGGKYADPSHREVRFGRSGHAEVVQVQFDPALMSYADLLRVFLSSHDPTTLNQQGADLGHQYRSIIFYHSEEQRQTAVKVLQEATGWFEKPIVTALEPYKAFYPAVSAHQNYYEQQADQPYCEQVISPKLAWLRATFANQLKHAPEATD